ncbi:putative lipoprotein [Bordetella hinzii CA90 BAL1384]|uniref:Lipoprotein n=1 Tax=Bordetella hinzii OH87 BAL007II TaxID=1331262 RepID=A0ABR4R475_9BORD|nr:putative lipoprotein [Bordetella hinzii OH87 BAL007II]KCB27995.1 putative lipoprotein [Bordetella hinzii CA90 BAL1384]KCB28308.1 putative lipoprotein [Bordetella hinzii L60]KCB46017.1 putative lipoprotein [Bordetella hinzii 4161]KCB52501.1 putative lipoprotein [Bordetella hinzii 1277]
MSGGRTLAHLPATFSCTAPGGRRWVGKTPRGDADGWARRTIVGQTRSGILDANQGNDRPVGM